MALNEALMYSTDPFKFTFSKILPVNMPIDAKPLKIRTRVISSGNVRLLRNFSTGILGSDETFSFVKPDNQKMILTALGSQIRK